MHSVVYWPKDDDKSGYLIGWNDVSRGIYVAGIVSCSYPLDRIELALSEYEIPAIVLGEMILNSQQSSNKRQKQSDIWLTMTKRNGSLLVDHFYYQNKPMDVKMIVFYQRPRSPCHFYASKHTADKYSRWKMVHIYVIQSNIHSQNVAEPF